MDPLVPNQVRYRTAPHSEEAEYYRLFSSWSINYSSLRRYTIFQLADDAQQTRLISRQQQPLTRAYRLVRSGIIWGLIVEKKIMEAERLNAISALLVDLTSRETELRGYL